MAQTLKFGNGNFATKAGSTLCYDDQNGNFKPIPMDFTRASTATRVNKQGLIEVVKSNVPRIDYTDTSDGVLLLENAATNNILYSQKISLTPTKNGTFVDNFAISPDGTQNATKLTATDADPYFYQNVTFAAVDYTASIYIKGIGNSVGKEFQIRLGSNIYTDVIPLEWTRFKYTVTMASGVTSSGLEIPNPAVVGDEVLVWGWQVEQNSVASSYIPSQGSASTRVAETASGAGNSDVFNDSEGVLFANIANLDTSVQSRLSLNSGNATTNKIHIGYNSNNTKIELFIIDGSNSTVVNSQNLITNNYSKVAVKYSSSSFYGYVNGFKTLIGTSRTPLGLNQLSFNRGDSVVNAYIKTKEISYYNTILTDLELETLTSYRSWESMVNELNLNIIYNG
jgi:hypothetical protein